MNLFIQQVSTYARDLDNLVILITVLVGFWFFVAEGAFFFLLFKYRKREGQKALYVDGTDPKHTRFISIPHIFILICDVVLIVAAVRVWVDIKQTLPPADETVRIIGQQWAWTFVQPGPDGKLDTLDDIRTVDEMHVRNNTTYHFQLQSKDVLHSFSVPVFRLKQDAIPGRTIIGWFKATRAGMYDIQCAEMCGIGHGAMAARLYVEEPEQHLAWMKAHAPVAIAAPEPAPAPAPAPAPEGTPPPAEN